MQYGIRAEALAVLNANGKLLIVFDGFDEMDLVGSADIRKRHFKSLWSLVRAEKSKILVTGRPNYFMDQNEMDAALNIYSDTKELAYCQRIYLQPFDEQQIKVALRKSSKSTQNGIEKIFKDEISSSFLDLISRPSNLFLISLIWDARKIRQKYANLTSAMLIDEFLQWSFGRQASKKGEENYCYLSPLEREYFMIGLAVRMRKLGNTVISYETFQESVEELIAIFPEELSGKNTYYLNFRNGKSIQNFANQDENSARAIINDVRSCGVLVNDYVNEGLTFAHKSFYDLLVAKYFLGKYYRKRDEYMIIASTLSEVAQYNLKIPRDLVIRKLLAELITMNINVEKNNQQAACEKIFVQCRNLIINAPLYLRPKSLLKMCNVDKNEMLKTRNRGYYRQEKKRFLQIMYVVPLVAVVFMIQNVYNMNQYREAARQYYMHVQTGATKVFSNMDTVFHYNIQIVFFGGMCNLTSIWCVKGNAQETF